MKLRFAELGDVPTMLSIYSYYVQNTTVSFEYTAPTLDDFTARFLRITEKFPWLVCEDGGIILGYAYADIAFAREAYSWDTDFSVYVHKDCRRAGIGRLLYTSLEKIVTLQGYHNIYALISGSNTTSLTFHQRMGFTALGVLPQCGFKMNSWVDVCWFGKRIRRPEVPGTKPVTCRALGSDLLASCLCSDRGN